MPAANLLNAWTPSSVTDRFSWLKPPIKPFRVWIFRSSNSNDGEVLGNMAQSLFDLKEKVKNYILSNGGKNFESNELSVLTLEDGTSIIDEEYFLQMPNTEDLLLLLPGQTWKAIHSNQLEESMEESIESKALVKRKTKCYCPQELESSEHRYFVPTPKGQMARLTLDVFKEKPAEAGCVRLTASTAGEAGLTVAYELRLNGVKAVLQYALRWSAVLLIHLGNVMTQSGKYLKERLS